MVARGTGGKTSYGYYWRKDGQCYYEKRKLELNKNKNAHD